MLEGPSFLISRDVPNSCEQENQWVYNTFRLVEVSNNKRRLELEEGNQTDADEEEKQTNIVVLFSSHDQNHADSNLLSSQLGRDISINCLVRCSRADYGLVASVNRSFRSLVRSGELYRIRRQMGIIEHWIYISCDMFTWEVFDPNRGRWMQLPTIPCTVCFFCADKESLAVGTDLLVFGKEMRGPTIYRYSILTHMWSSDTEMNTPRCLFGSASLGEIAILAGGCNVDGKILSAAELYNADTGKWETLPDMNKARKLCSAVFMDGKFYVLGGVGVDNRKLLSCGEEFDLKTKKWRVIPNMFPARVAETDGTEAPPLVAVVNNVLYAADHARREVRRYVKESNSWVTVGRLPRQSKSTNGWGLAFRACGDRLIVIGGGDGSSIQINAWVPDEGAPRWELLARKAIHTFVYNCAVMGC